MTVPTTERLPLIGKSDPLPRRASWQWTKTLAEQVAKTEASTVSVRDFPPSPEPQDGTDEVPGAQLRWRSEDLATELLQGVPDWRLLRLRSLLLAALRIVLPPSVLP